MKRTIVMGVCIGLGLSAGAYAEGNAAAGKAKAEACFGCHGEDGNAAAPMFPKLAGQHASYLAKELREFKSEKRKEPTMNAMSASLEEADINDIAAYFAGHKIKTEPEQKNPVGEKLYRGGNPTNKLPACSGCHGPDGAGNPISVYPRIGGQYAAYLSKALNDYKTAERNNDPGAIMRTIAARLSEEEINALADYVSGLQ